MVASAFFLLRRALLVASLALIPLNLVAQVVPAGYGPPGPIHSKWDIFAGYSYLAPSGSIPPPGAGGPLAGEPGTSYQPIGAGTIFSATRFFRNGFGVEVIADRHTETERAYAGTNGNSFGSGNDFAGFEGGVVYRHPIGRRWSPFGQFLYGGERVGAEYQREEWGKAFTLGGGIDFRLTSHWSIRAAQIDFQHIGLPTNDANAFRFSTGVVYHFGWLPH
jgi:opacity protein-like surface antigen